MGALGQLSLLRSCRDDGGLGVLHTPAAVVRASSGMGLLATTGTALLGVLTLLEVLEPSGVPAAPLQPCTGVLSSRLACTAELGVVEQSGILWTLPAALHGPLQAGPEAFTTHQSILKAEKRRQWLYIQNTRDLG